MARGLMRVLARMPRVDRNVVWRALMRPPALTEVSTAGTYIPSADEVALGEQIREAIASGYHSAELLYEERIANLTAAYIPLVEAAERWAQRRTDVLQGYVEGWTADEIEVSKIATEAAANDLVRAIDALSDALVQVPGQQQAIR